MADELVLVSCRLLAFSSEGSANPAANVLASGGLTWQTAEPATSASLTFDIGQGSVVRSVRLEQCLVSPCEQLFATVRGEVGGVRVTLFERQAIDSNALLSLSCNDTVTRLELELDVGKRRVIFSTRRVRLFRDATHEEAEALARKRDAAALKQRAGCDGQQHMSRAGHEHGSAEAGLLLPLSAKAPAAPAARPLSAMLEGARTGGFGAPLGARNVLPRSSPWNRGQGQGQAASREAGCHAPPPKPAQRSKNKADARPQPQEAELTSKASLWRVGGGKRLRPSQPADDREPFTPTSRPAPHGEPSALACLGPQRPSADGRDTGPAAAACEVIDLISADEAEDDDSNVGTPAERHWRSLPGQWQLKVPLQLAAGATRDAWPPRASDFIDLS